VRQARPPRHRRFSGHRSPESLPPFKLRTSRQRAVFWHTVDRLSKHSSRKRSRASHAGPGARHPSIRIADFQAMQVLERSLSPQGRRIWLYVRPWRVRANEYTSGIRPFGFTGLQLRSCSGNGHASSNSTDAEVWRDTTTTPPMRRTPAAPGPGVRHRLPHPAAAAPAVRRPRPAVVTRESLDAEISRQSVARRHPATTAAGSGGSVTCRWRTSRMTKRPTAGNGGQHPGAVRRAEVRLQNRKASRYKRPRPAS